jgi:integrase
MAAGARTRTGYNPGRLIALRMFYDYLCYICEEGVANPVITQRHYIYQGHRLPRDIRQSEIEKLFTAIGDHLRDRTIFTLMLHTGMRVGEVINLRLADVYLSENRPPHLAKYCRQADIWITCHQLRHTFACRMIAAEVPVTSVQKMLGHTSIRTPQLYVNVADRQVEQDYHAGIQKVIENCAILSEVSHL